MENLFPRSANVLTADQWVASLPAGGLAEALPQHRNN
jgi:hypothetical protein